MKSWPLFGDEYLLGLYHGRVSPAHVLKSYAIRLAGILTAQQFDLIWVEKEIFPWVPGFFEKALIPRGIPLVVDYDDALFHRYDQHKSGLVRALLGKKIDRIMQRADLVIVGNEYLGSRARIAGAKRIEWLPTVVDTDRYQVSPVNTTMPMTIGWIGSPATAHYMRQVMPLLEHFITTGRARVIAVGANRAQMEGLPIETRSWQEESEVKEIQSFDIGIMPLPDRSFERGKCGYKLIQYMACGKPVVASPVGANSVIVRNGIDGFLAETTPEWTNAIEALCDDPSLRQQMGLHGRQRVEGTYSLQAAAPRLEALLRSVV